MELKEIIECLTPPTPLSRASVETAAIIAYKQPTTAAEVPAIRGVDNSDALQTLLRRKLIAPAGRAKARGNPVLYRTTRCFLLHFRLKDLTQLTAIRELRPVHGIVSDPEFDWATSLPCRFSRAIPAQQSRRWSHQELQAESWSHRGLRWPRKSLPSPVKGGDSQPVPVATFLV
jgi:segregation and condensation protein B